MNSIQSTQSLHRSSTARRAIVLLFAVLFASAGEGSAAEIYSNGVGGGPWSDAASWKGGKVPTGEDDVVIARDDAITFDRNDEGKVSCHLLSLDPRSVLQFKTQSGPVVLRVSGPLESYGGIKLDATKAAGDRHELHLIAETIEERTAKFFKGGSLVVAGRPVFGKNKPNAAIRAFAPPTEEKKDPPSDPTAVIQFTEGGTLDLQRSEFENTVFEPTGIDNTGAKPGERMNVVRNHFIGTSRFHPTSCDTPLIADNVFERESLPPLQQAALYVNSCPLAELRGNTVRGTYAGGITVYGGVDVSVTNTLLEKLPQGLYMYVNNGMVRGLHIRDCGHGLTMTSASGALEDVLIERCTSGYSHAGAAVQFTNLQFREMPANAAYDIHYTTGPLTLLNCPIKPEQIKFNPGSPMPPADSKPHPPPVQSLYYVVANVKGSYPTGINLEVKSVNPTPPVAPGAQDPNVRNSPAEIASSGYTPFPKSLEPLIVRAWHYDDSGKLVKSAGYQLQILSPEIPGQSTRPVLKTHTIVPDDSWYRPQPNDKKPTVEVMLP